MYEPNLTFPRNIWPKIWTNENLSKVEQKSLLLYVGLISIADSEGKLEFSANRLQSVLRNIDTKDLIQMVNQLILAKVIKCYTIKDRVFLSFFRWGEYQEECLKEKPSQIPNPPEDTEVIYLSIEGVTKNPAYIYSYSSSYSSLNLKSIDCAEKEIKCVIPFDLIIGHLNRTAGKKFKYTSEHHRKHIRARWGEGFKLEDFYYVNEVKCREWLGTAYEKFLRPETLYGTKFDGYLNQKPNTINISDRLKGNIAAAQEFIRSKNDGVRDVRNDNGRVSGYLQDGTDTEHD